MLVNKWLRRVRGAIGMGVTWALVWGPAAVLLSLVVDPDGSMDEMWVAIGAIPGFLGGVVFSVLLATATRRRRVDELSAGHVGTWGMLAGLVIGLFPVVVLQPNLGQSMWLLGSVVAGTISVLSAVSAAGSLLIARRGADDALLGTRAVRGLQKSTSDRMQKRPANR